MHPVFFRRFTGAIANGREVLLENLAFGQTEHF